MRFVDRVLVMHRALDDAGIGHAFGGAIALAYAVHEPRATIDIDLNISADPMAPRVVLKAMPPGVTWGAADVRAIRADGQVRLRWDNVPVDLFFPQHAFHAVVADRSVMVPLEDAMIPVISATDLMVFKALFNRTKDWADIEAILEAGTAHADEALDWLEQIVGVDAPSYERLAALARNGPATDRRGPSRWS